MLRPDTIWFTLRPDAVWLYRIMNSYHIIDLTLYDTVWHCHCWRFISSQAVANHVDSKYEPLHSSGFSLGFNSEAEDIPGGGGGKNVTRVLVVVPALTSKSHGQYVKALHALARGGGIPGSPHTPPQALFVRTLKDEASEENDGPDALFPTLRSDEVYVGYHYIKNGFWLLVSDVSFVFSPISNPISHTHTTRTHMPFWMVY